LGGVYGPDRVARPGGLVQALDPFPVTTADFDVQLAGSSGIRPWKVRLANESPYALRIDCGGFVDWLASGTVDVWPTGGASVMHVHPIALCAPEPVPSMLSSLLLVTVAGQGEEFPGTYPMAMGRLTSVYTNREQLWPIGSPATPGTPSMVVTGGTSPTNRFTIPNGTVSLRLLVSANGTVFSYNLLVVGHQTVTQYFGSITAPGSVAPVASPTLPLTLSIEYDDDSQIDIIVNPSVNVNVWVNALFAPESPGQSGDSQSVIIPAPSAWQTPNNDWMLGSGGIGAGATLNLIPAVAGQTVYLWEQTFHLGAGAAGSFGQLQDTFGTGLRQMNFAIADNYPFQFNGRALFPGRGLQLKNTSAANSGSLNGGGSYRQQP
jgi:hypothetical protein